MAEQVSFSTMYVELDCLLDTRMATLFLMGEENCTKALDFKYHDRVTDLIRGVDREAFLEMYNKRDKETLREALVTPVSTMIKEFVQRTRENTLSSPFHYIPKIMLNVHPYELDDEEIRLIRNVVNKITSGLAEIEVINKPPKEITPLFVKFNLTLMVMYRYDEWLELHCANKLFEKTQVPDVSLLGPRVYFKKPETPPKEGEDPFRAMEETASPLINLHLLPASVFSLVVKLEKKA